MPPTRPTGDLFRLQGTWSIASLEIEGQPMPAAGRIIIKGGKFTTQSMGAEYKGNIVAEDGKLDLQFTSGPEKGNTSLGIYKLKGDTLQLCLALTASKRPARFKTLPGSGLALEILHREGSQAAAKASGDPVTLPVTFQPAPELEGDWQLTSASMNGQPLPQDYVESGRRTASNNEFRVSLLGQTMLHARFNIDRTTQPHAIDYYVYGPGETIRLQYGIWKLEGELLTTAIGIPGSPRPSQFVPGPAITLTVWRRTGSIPPYNGAPLTALH